jgi:hypothetical protein
MPVAFLASLYPYWGEAAAFAVSAAAALLWDWQASDIAWGLWISSLVTGWVILGASILRAWLNAAGIYRLHADDDPAGSPRVQQVQQLILGGSGDGRAGLLVALGVTAFGAFTWFHFTIFHAILGAIMSVFLAAEPLDLLGPNGFINADSSQLLAFLIATYLAIILATLVTRWRCIVQGNPVQRMQSIYTAIIRLHVFVLLSGLLSFVAVFGESVYQQVMVLTLLFLCYFPFGRIQLTSSKSWHDRPDA